MTLENLMAISVIIIIIGILFLAIRKYLEERRNCHIHGGFVVLSIAIIILGVTVLVSCIDIKKEINMETALAEDWPFYVNGVEVEPENIYLGGYNIKYDENEKKVFLYPKAGNAIW